MNGRAAKASRRRASSLVSRLAARLSAWLNPRRLRAQAVVLALCLWSVAAVDFATPGFFDRAGNIKFQDFIQFYVSARLIAEGRVDHLFDPQVTFDEMRAIVYEKSVSQTSALPPTRVRLPPVYGPQVGLLFVPLAQLPFPVAARIWAFLSIFLYLACVYVVWTSCANLRSYPGLVAAVAVAFPPLFHVFMRGQITILMLACFTVAWLAFRAERPWMAGFALGLLVLKPQFLVAIPLVLLLDGAWRPLAATVFSAAAQLALTWIVFGSSVMRAYFETLLHMSRFMEAVEPGTAQIQMHSLRAFWSLLIPWPQVALFLYILSSIAVIMMAAAVWRSSADPALRFAALTLAAVLVNPHLFVYDLLVLAPALLLLVEWAMRPALCKNDVDLFRVLLYLAFILPLLGPLSRWIHVQLSVLDFVALLLVLWRHSVVSPSIPAPPLAPS